MPIEEQNNLDAYSEQGESQNAPTLLNKNISSVSIWVIVGKLAAGLFFIVALYVQWAFFANMSFGHDLNIISGFFPFLIYLTLDAIFIMGLCGSKKIKSWLFVSVFILIVINTLFFMVAFAP
jgi:hypothetical protein